VTEAAPTAPAATDDHGEGDGWQRVHPLTPLLRSWQALAVALLFFGQDIGESALSGDGLGDGLTADLADNRLVGALVGLVLITLIGAYASLSWRFTRYRVTADALEVHRGVIARQQRRAPLDRLQSVDITEPLLARITGLAKLTLEVAGGAGSKIEIAFLTERHARQLRNHLLAAAGGMRSDAGAPPQVAESPELRSLTVPVERLLGSIALSGGALTALVVVIGVGVAIVATGEANVALAVVPVLLGAGGVLWQRFTRGFGFRVGFGADGLRIRHGLLEQRTQSVPTGRVQAVRLHQPLLWRTTGWWSVEVNVAGYGLARSTDGSVTGSTVLPVGTLDEAFTVLTFIVPSLPHDPRFISGSGPDAGFTAAPRRARWVDPIGWRRHGFRVTDHALLLRGGRLHRQLDVVPHARTQSCAVWQGPLQRRLGLASFELHSTPGPILPRCEHLSSTVAADLLEHQAERARTARSAATDAWLSRIGEATREPPGEPAGEGRSAPPSP
jgi:putative membrane protein